MLKYPEGAGGTTCSTPQEFSSTTQVPSSSACILADIPASSLQLLELQSSNSTPNAMNSEVSFNSSFLSEHLSSFPTTPNAEDLFKNLPKSTTPELSDTDPESTNGVCISNNNYEVLSTQSAFTCGNPTFSYSNVTHTLTESSAGNSCLIYSDFQNGQSERLYVPPSLINGETYKSSVVGEPLDVRYDNSGSLESINSSPIAMKSPVDKSYFTIHVGNNCEVFRELATDSPPVSCSSAFHVSNSSEYQAKLTEPMQHRSPVGNSFKGKNQGFLHEEIASPQRTDNDKSANPDIEKDSEMGVLPPDLCLFEVVSMLKCGRCDDVFPDTASLIQHYQKSHLAGCGASPVQIKVDTAANAVLQKNKPVVVCHKCGSKVPSSVLEWYVAKVRGKMPGRRRKVQPSNEPVMAPLSAPSDPSSPASDVHARSDIQACPNDASTHTHNWALPHVCGSPESCDDTSQTVMSREEPASPPGESSTTSHAGATGHCSDGSSELSEEESVMDDGSKKEGSGDSTMQVYVLDVLGGTTECKSGQGADGDSVRQKRLVRPPAKLSDDEPLPAALQTPPKIHKCSMEGCRLRFSSPELRDLHRRCHRPADASGLPFICPFCSFTMKKWYSVQRHLWQVHQQDVDMLQCSVCSTYRAHNTHTMRVHLETHSTLKPYSCQTCGQRFRQLSQLLNHSRTHRNEKQQLQPAVRCSECGKPCCNERQLARHVKAVHEKVCLHRCTICPYATNRPADLRSHNRRHAKDKSFECCVCEMRFCDQTSQRRHLLRHLPLSLLQCPICSFHTSRLQHFSSHFSALHPPQQLQQPALSFECKLCGETCSTVSQYCSHSRTHHSDLLQQLVAQHPPASKPS